MKRQKYDTIMDIVSIIFTIILLWVIGGIITSVLLGSVVFGVSFVFDLLTPWKTTIIISTIIGGPLGIFTWLFCRSSNLYSTEQLRDFWMPIGHLVELEGDNQFKKSKEIHEWCESNCSSLYQKASNRNNKWIFLKKSDAMAFKLRWQ